MGTAEGKIYVLRFDFLSDPSAVSQQSAVVAQQWSELDDGLCEDDAMLNNASLVRFDVVAKRDAKMSRIVGLDTYSTPQVVSYATATGQLGLWDTRSRREGSHIQLHASSGLIRSFMLDPARRFCVLSTNLGAFQTWDWRFLVPVKVWN